METQPHLALGPPMVPCFCSRPPWCSRVDLVDVGTAGNEQAFWKWVGSFKHVTPICFCPTFQKYTIIIEKEMCKIFINTKSADTSYKLPVNRRSATSFTIVQQPPAAQYLFAVLLIHQESYSTRKTKFLCRAALSSLLYNYRRRETLARSHIL